MTTSTVEYHPIAQILSLTVYKGKKCMTHAFESTTTFEEMQTEYTAMKNKLEASDD